MSKLPRGASAIVDLFKLREYCLSPSHPRGRHKARVFASTLGLEAADAAELREALLRAARECDAEPGDEDQYGRRYVVDSVMERRTVTATIRSVWILPPDEGPPRLVTCYVHSTTFA